MADGEADQTSEETLNRGRVCPLLGYMLPTLLAQSGVVVGCVGGLRAAYVFAALPSRTTMTALESAEILANQAALIEREFDHFDGHETVCQRCHLV